MKRLCDHIAAKTRRLPAVARLAMLALLAPLAVLTGCDSVIYDSEGDCDVHYRLRFRFDYNLLYADAFSHAVHSVAVYGFDGNGVLAWQKTDSGEALGAEGYALDLDDVAPGEYTVIAWCGLENDGTRPESFSVPEMLVGSSTMEDLTCRMRREAGAEGGSESVTDLYPLFYGRLDNVVIVDEDSPEAEPGTHTYTLPLMKDTNHVRIILQQLNGEDVDVDDFTFTIEESNGYMAHTNELLPDDMITYRAWNKSAGSAGLGYGDYPSAGAGAASAKRKVAAGGITDVKVAIADLTVARLMDDRRTMLTIRRNDPEGAVVAQIPLRDYALLVKDCYSGDMDDQEYLDRQDEYTLTFFLDDDYRWTGARIVINSWRVVITNVEL